MLWEIYEVMGINNIVIKLFEENYTLNYVLNIVSHRYNFAHVTDL